MRARLRLRLYSIAADLLAAVAASAGAVWLRSLADTVFAIKRLPFQLDWSTLVVGIAVLVAHYANGLYEREAYVSRPLHSWLIVKSSFLAFVGSALVVYLLKSDAVDQSRFILTLTFLLFIALDWVLRLLVVDRAYIGWVARVRPACFVIGESREAQNLTERLGELRGFSRAQLLPPAALRPDMATSLGELLDATSHHGASADCIFVDTLSVSPREVFELTGVGLERSVDVYILSGLLGPLEGSRVLFSLFQAPMIRVRRSLDNVGAHLFKRVFDMIGSALLLVAASPVIAVLAIGIKMSSPGPVFYSQTRVGRFGIPFKFYKFRSMVVNNDSTSHEQFVKAFINGGSTDGAGEEDLAFKIADDPRVTRIGRFIRKYSFDEIPQFFNVLLGDMSLVGPRPPLAYEVDNYDEWHMARLAVPPGITGMWQVEGRSRVTFDEMILQDLMYAKNMGMLVDISLCLRTVPAALLAYGGA